MFNLFTNKMITYTGSVYDSHLFNLSDKFYGAFPVVANHRRFQSFCIVAGFPVFLWMPQKVILKDD